MLISSYALHFPIFRAQHLSSQAAKAKKDFLLKLLRYLTNKLPIG